MRGRRVMILSRGMNHQFRQGGRRFGADNSLRYDQRVGQKLFDRHI